MDFEVFLTSHRKEYLKALKIIVDKFPIQENYEPFLEVLDEKESDISKGETPFILFRYDVLIKSPEGNYYDIKVEVDPNIFTNPLMFKEGNAEIIVRSFLWDACEIEFSNPSQNLKIFEDWYFEEIKPDNKGLNKDLINVIHNITSSSKKNSIIIDFGSCEVKKVLNLFDQLTGNEHNKFIINAAYS